MEPGTRVRLVALPVERWTPWPEHAMPAEDIARRAGELGTVLPGHDYLPDGCALVVVDGNAASAEDDDDGTVNLYAFNVPFEALAVVSARAPERKPSAPDPWRPGAHDEERIAAGGERQLYSQGQRPPDNRLPPERVCAPGAAGRWLAVGMIPETDYSGDHPVTYTTTVWARWLVPVSG